jgi:hypothetical protein
LALRSVCIPALALRSLRNLPQELAGPANYFALAHQGILINLLFLLA